MEIKLSHRLAVGKKGGPAPVINDLDWNKLPKACDGKGAIAMLACVSTFGTNIYYLPESTRRWTTMVIKRRPSREGQALHWHLNGKILASASNPKESKPGNLSILRYDSNFMCFNADKIYECSEGSMITSLRWNFNGTRLAIALRPSSEILIFGFDKDSMELSYVGHTKCMGFPQNTAVALEWHSSLRYLFACAPDAKSIIVWGPPFSDNLGEEDARIGLEIDEIVPVELGLCGMEFNKSMDGLFTFEKGFWQFWAFSEVGPVLTCEFESTNEHMAIKERYCSELISFSSSQKCFLASSGGSNDTMAVHKKDRRSKHRNMNWTIEGSRKKDVCYGAAKCLKFHPKDDFSMRVAMGGDSGYIHIWAIYQKTSPKMEVPVPDRRNEQFYYRKFLNPRNVDLPSTSSGDEDKSGDDEVELEKAPHAAAGDDDDGDDDDDDDDGDDDDDDGDGDGGGGSGAAAAAGDGLVELHGVEVSGPAAGGQKSGERELEVIMQGVTGLTIGGSGQHEGQKNPSEAFDEISSDAKRIADRIEAEGTVSPAEVKALCQKILNSRGEISKAIKGEGTGS